MIHLIDLQTMEDATLLSATDVHPNLLQYLLRLGIMDTYHGSLPYTAAPTSAAAWRVPRFSIILNFNNHKRG